MAAEDVHLARRPAADFGGKHFLAGRADRVGLGLVEVFASLGRVTPALELLFDPVDRARIALGPLLAITERSESLDDVLVALEVESRDDLLDRTVGRGHRCTRIGRA